MHTEIKSSEIKEIEKFLRDCANSLEGKQLTVNKKGDVYVAELYEVNETPT